MRIDGKTALVTGAASGLGAATAAALVQRGARVVACDLVPCPVGDFSKVDVTDSDQIRAAIPDSLHIAVSCAGIAWGQRTASRDGPHDLEAFRRILEVNLTGTFNVLRLAAAVMSTQEPDGEERGVIVNTSSISAFDGQIGQVAYSASKAGVAGMTLPAARDLSSRGIRVMAIAPGTFDTPMLAGLPEESRAALAGQVPHPARLGDPAEFAALVCHIVENPMLNGEVIRLDGALRMAPK